MNKFNSIEIDRGTYIPFFGISGAIKEISIGEKAVYTNPYVDEHYDFASRDAVVRKSLGNEF